MVLRACRTANAMLSSGGLTVIPMTFTANASLLLIVIFSSLIRVLSLHAALRCCLRPVLQHDSKPIPDPESSHSEAFPTLVYSPGLNLAGTEAKCITCLSGLQDGDTLRVFDRCKHEFHVHCIHQWFSYNPSYPHLPYKHLHLTNRNSLVR